MDRQTSRSSSVVPVAVVALVALSLVASFLIDGVAAQVRPSCARGLKCPIRDTRQCGVFKSCDYDVNGNIKASAPFTICDSCAYSGDVNKPPTDICNFQYGRCVPNAIQEGKPCTANAQCNAAAGLTCRPVKGKVGKSRCCRTKCPPGLCGTGKKQAKYTSLCGETFVCNGICPK